MASFAASVLVAAALVTAAAEVLGVSQPDVSRYLAGLMAPKKSVLMLAEAYL